MKKIYAVIVFTPCVFAMVSSTTSAKVSTTDEYGLRGKVASFHETVIPADPSRGYCPPGHHNIKVSFNDRKLVSEKIVFDWNGIWQEKQKITYDSHDSPVLQINERADGSSDSISNANTYDENNRLVSVMKTKNKDGFGNTVISYDEKGREIKVLIKGYTTLVFEYDPQGRKKKQDRFRDNGEPFSTNTFSYDQAGRVTEHCYTNLDDGTVITYLFQYNTHDDVIKYTEKEGTKTTIWGYQYLYDSQGNWTQKEITVDGIPAWEIKREIVYAQ